MRSKEIGSLLNFKLERSFKLKKKLKKLGFKICLKIGLKKGFYGFITVSGNGRYRGQLKFSKIRAENSLNGALKVYFCAKTDKVFEKNCKNCCFFGDKKF